MTLFAGADFALLLTSMLPSNWTRTDKYLSSSVEVIDISMYAVLFITFCAGFWLPAHFQVYTRTLHLELGHI